MAKEFTESTREGGREDAERPTSGLSGAAPPRNSSGAASAAASILDLRQKVNLCLELLEYLALEFGNHAMVETIRRSRQQGFRRGR